MPSARLCQGHDNIVRPVERVGRSLIWEYVQGLPWNMALPRLTSSMRIDVLWPHYSRFGQLKPLNKLI